MFGIQKERISRHAVLTFDNGYRTQATLYMPPPSRPIFQENLERYFIEQWNKSQPNAKHKIIKCHIMRN